MNISILLAETKPALKHEVFQIDTWIEQQFIQFLRIFSQFEKLPWIEISILIVISSAVGFILSLVFSKILNVQKNLGYIRIEFETSKKFFQSFRNLVVLLLIHYGLQELLHKKAITFIDKPLSLMILIVSILFLQSIWGVLSDIITYRSQNLSREAVTIIVPFVQKFVHFVIIIFGGLIIISALGVNVNNLWTMAGAGTVVLGLAAKDSIENFFGSVTILLDRPFGVGDWVMINGVTGTVEEINIRNTKVRTQDDSLVTVPNGNLVKAIVENFGLRRHRLIKNLVPLSKETPSQSIQEFRDAIFQLYLSHPKTKKDGIYVYFNDMHGSGYDIMMNSYLEVESYDEQLQVQQELLLSILKIAEVQQIEIISPKMTTNAL